MPRASTKVFKKRRGVFNKGRCNKSNDGCGESNSTVPKNSSDEKNCADGAKLCTNETEPSASKGAESARMFCGIMNLPPPPTKFSKYNHILLQATRETCEHSMAEAVREAVDENDGKRDLAVTVDGSWQKRGFLRRMAWRWGLKAFTSIVENKVYGDHCSVEKLECIGHVMKRMGTRLRRLKTKMRGQKLSDGKPLCGRNRLTEAEIDRLQAYYGLAIRRNLSSVKDMQQAIWAIFFTQAINL
ncbi:uncharacterized protein TNCV_680421 [Trichonephila clavipes]|nr:uncharacterized protein TNCV_680421 [Trichonephila clavipes]